MHSHISVVHNSCRIYLHILSNSGCQQLHETDTLSLGGSAIISGAVPNSTMTSSINLARSTTEDRRCSGTQYSDPYGTWDEVIVQATIRITLKDYEAPIERTTSQLIRPSGQRCDARRGECLDSENGQTFWSVIPQESCQFDRCDVLYEGTAIKLMSKNNQTMLTVFTTK
jgi:hypothetical protein